MNSLKRKTNVEIDFDSKNKTPKLDDSSNKPVTVLNVDRYASNRAIEIQALTDLVKNVGGNHQAFQKLPPHMRRRAMSHNIKRVPRRLRDLAKSELDKVKAPGKRPSRKFRRKPSNLLSEYEKRKRKTCWLDTHIWHAKRFKMMEAWGHRLPNHPTDKSIRSCYRAVQRHCLMQDVSYENYIEIKGKRESIISGLCHLSSQETGPTFAAKMTSSGSKQGSLFLYSYDSYPQKVIGRVTYLWCTESRNSNRNDSSSTLWICCHPSFESEALNEIRKCFNKQSSPSISETFVKADLRSEVNKKTNSDGVMGAVEDPLLVSVTSLKHEIVKFRLFGPASNQVLKETLDLWDTNKLCTDNGKGTNRSLDVAGSGEIKKQDDHSTTDMWWKSFYQSAERQKENEMQTKVWSAVMSCRNAAEVPVNLVVAATVKDPRLKLPPKRNKVSVLDADTSIERLQSDVFTNEVSISPLWDKDVRQNVKTTKITERSLNDMKSKHLVPGTRLELGEKESRIPIILIQRPGLTDCSPSNSSIPSGPAQYQIGYASGWDILIPAGWAMAFWVALVYRGARVGGQREARSIGLQSRQLVGVRDAPDSTAGKKQLDSEGAELQTKYNKRPPAKRPNHVKLGFDSPFFFPFAQLCKEWSRRMNIKIETEMYVLRHRSTLRMLHQALIDPIHFLQSQKHLSGQNHKSSSVPKQFNMLGKFLSSYEGRRLVEVHGSAIVPIAVTVVHKGVPTRNAHICIPSKEDLKIMRATKGYGGPEEIQHPDEDGPRRKSEKKERLKHRKGRKSKKASSVEEKASHVKVCEEKKDVLEESVHSKEEKSLNLISTPSRSIIGFVTVGDYDLGQGQGSGIGFCSVIGLLHLLEAQGAGGQKKPCLGLVRNPTSLQYRFVSVSVML